MSWPATRPVPLVGTLSVVSIRTSVVLPAPLGPSRPRTVPSGTTKLTPSTATVSPKCLTRSMASTAVAAPETAVADPIAAVVRIMVENLGIASDNVVLASASVRALPGGLVASDHLAPTLGARARSKSSPVPRRRLGEQCGPECCTLGEPRRSQLRRLAAIETRRHGDIERRSPVARSVRSPAARGPLADRLLQALAGPLASVPDLPVMAARMVSGCRALTDEDIQLSLLVLQELHYDGIDTADERWERSPDLVATRVVLEDACEAELRAAVEGPVSQVAQLAHVDVAAAIFELADAVEAPPLSAYLHRQASLEQLREFLVHRSVYHLKEADPHTWLVPRLRGAPKAALLEVQIDEYGGGRLDRMHARCSRGPCWRPASTPHTVRTSTGCRRPRLP